MLWLPSVRAAVVNVAVVPDKATVASSCEPSSKVTVPVGVPLTFSVAVKVTDWPSSLGLSDETSDTPVVAAAIVPEVVWSAVCGVPALSVTRIV